MSRFKLLSGVRISELLFCLLLVNVLLAWSLVNYRAYIVNARILNPYHKLQEARLSISIDNAYTGSFSNSPNYKSTLDSSYPTQIEASSQGHIKATFDLDRSDEFAQADLIGKTLVLLRNAHTQDGFQFHSWRCSDSPGPDVFSITNPIANSTLDVRYRYFICHGDSQ